MKVQKEVKVQTWQAGGNQYLSNVNVPALHADTSAIVQRATK